MTTDKTCSVGDCSRPEAYTTLKMCRLHYQRHLSGICIGQPVRLFNPGRGCAFTNCTRDHLTGGYCGYHDQQIRQNKPLATAPPMRNRYTIMDNVSCPAAHSRVKALWGSASGHHCVGCGAVAQEWAYDGCDSSQLYGPTRIGTSDNCTISWTFYSRFPEFYMPMCKKCHRQRDATALAVELREYREWKYATGMTIKDLLISEKEPINA